MTKIAKRTQGPSFKVSGEDQDINGVQFCMCQKHAAALDLLEAAKIISGWIERVAEEVTMGPDDQRALNNLRAAIKKAEGEKP